MEIQSSTKEKICPCCEGRITAEAKLCPYCASMQENGEEEQERQGNSLFDPDAISKSLAGLYSPPYGQKAKTSGGEPSRSFPQIDPSFSSPYKMTTTSSQEDPLANIAKEETAESPSVKFSFLPLVLLFAGVQALLLALMLLFFARDGFLCLEWKASHWPFYLLASGAFLFWGRRELKKMKE